MVWNADKSKKIVPIIIIDIFKIYIEDEYKDAYDICLKNNEMVEKELKDGKNMKTIAQNSNNDLKAQRQL